MQESKGMGQQVAVDPKGLVDDITRESRRRGKVHVIAPDLAYRRLAIVNVIFFGPARAADRHWVMIDAGVIGMTSFITGAAEERFAPNSRPAAIILTHGHFDHVGALEELSSRWEAPVYAHDLDHPYLDGRASYPPPDPSVGGGLMSLLSPLYPRGPVNASGWLRSLPPDGSVPEMPGWRWLHTPGHSPGHISLWRESDRAIIAGDACITTRQESAYAVAVQKPEIHGPPMYYTIDWQKARASVELLASLEPELIVTGHGAALKGTEMRASLHELACEFDRVAVPSAGKYVKEPASAESGSAYRRP